MMAILLLFPVIALAATTAPAPPGAQSLFTEENLKLRDPFQSPIFSAPSGKISDLESYSLDQLKLVGVMTGPRRVRAMLAAPDGRMLFINEKARVGNRQGVVKKITEDGVIVTERIVNLLGQEEIFDTEMKMPVIKRAAEGAPPAQNGQTFNGQLIPSYPGQAQ